MILPLSQMCGKSSAAFILGITWVVYTLWTIGTPFIDADQPVLLYIPSLHRFAWGVVLPILAASAFGSLVVGTLGILLITS